MGEELNTTNWLNTLAPFLEEDNLDGFTKAYKDFCNWLNREKWRMTGTEPSHEDRTIYAIYSIGKFLITYGKKMAISQFASALSNRKKLGLFIRLSKENQADYEDKSGLLQEVELSVIKALVEKDFAQVIREDLVKEANRINQTLPTDFETLKVLSEVYEKLGLIDEALRIQDKAETRLVIKDEALTTKQEIIGIIEKFTSPIKQALVAKSKQLDGKQSELEKKHKKLNEEYGKLKIEQDELAGNFEKNKVRLVETLGLFAAIIAFVIAGIVGLQGLTAAGIAISITGLTAGLVVLVTLINIFTSSKKYIWGKVAVLGIAFLILIAWLVVTVFFKPAIFQ